MLTFSSSLENVVQVLVTFCFAYEKTFALSEHMEINGEKERC